MMTIKIAEDVTVTMSKARIDAYYKGLEADENLKTAYNNENLDWQDIENLWWSVHEIWDRFINM